MEKVEESWLKKMNTDSNRKKKIIEIPERKAFFCSKWKKGHLGGYRDALYFKNSMQCNAKMEKNLFQAPMVM